MKIRRLRAVARKEFIHVLRDKRSLGLSILIPVMLLFLFGYALSLDVDRIPLAVIDRDASFQSREFLSSFQGSRYFSLNYYCSNYREVEELIDARKALAGIVIPPEFSRKIFCGKNPEIQVLLDGSDSTTAGIAMGYFNAISMQYNAEVLKSRMETAISARFVLPVDMRPRVLYNPELKSRNFIVPGLIALIMMVIAALLTSQTVSREWENGNLELLKPSPLLPSEMILGKLIPYFVIGMTDVAISIFIGIEVFDVPFRGSLTLLFALSSLFLLSALSMGIFISVAAKSQLVSAQFALVTTFLPAFLLSGFIFDINNMPAVVRLLSRIAVPARYFVTIIKAIYLKGNGFSFFAAEVISLFVFAIVMLIVAERKLKNIFR
ncbi:MAG: ABC transporter permease [Candidatus Wallbacteria bacterium]|nr:ABC transporter permease [Candidatus Wallbacteria bacterium]